MTRAVILGLFASLVAAGPQERGKHEVLVDAPSVFAPESKAGLRVAVYESKGLFELEPAADAEVAVALKDKAGLFGGKTDAKGTLDASFAVPALPDGEYVLQVRTKSAAGESVHEQPVRLKREWRILLVTDKPLYQPGQTIQLRALALDEMTLREAAGGEVLFEVEDAKGNKVFKRKAAANAFGVAATSFALADEVNAGDFRVTASLGTSKAERSVTVKRYVLPKFKVQTRTDKAFYLPLETVKGSLKADYFFGKPVKDAVVTVKASTFDAQLREFAQAKGKTAADGSWEFEIRLPDTFVGIPLEKGNAFLQLDVSVIDPADHEERSVKTLSVADALLQVNAVPESGKLVPGVENVLYVLATAPDGSAVEADVEVKAGAATVAGRTNGSGFAALRLTPKLADLVAGRRGEAVLRAEVTAKDAKGNSAKKALELSSEVGRDQLLLRLDKAIYRAGEAAQLELFGTFDRGVIFIDAVRKGQTLLTTTCEFEKGRAQYRLPLAPELFGSLEIHAYKIMADGDIVRDTRVVYVQPPQDLEVRVSTDKPQYAPAEEAKISFRVTDRGGKGVQSALGVVIVDESVYALQDLQPGLERVYFTLQQELLAPKFGIKIAESVPDLIGARELQERRQEAGKILLAPAAVSVRRWTVNSLAERMAQVAGKAQSVYQALSLHILGQKKVFWKDGAFKPALLQELVDAKLMPADALVDPWGRPLTMASLARYSEAFSFDHWSRLRSAETVHELWNGLVEGVVGQDPGPALLKPRSDCFGQPFTLERLEKEDAAFAMGNLVRLAADRRKALIFEVVRKHVSERGGVVPEGAGWAFAPGFQEAVATKPCFRKPGGGEYSIDELAREQACFGAANLARLADIDRRGALYAALRAKAAKDGFESLAGFDKAWTWKPGVLAILVRDGLLTEGQTKDVAGRTVDFDAVAKEDPQFQAQALLASILSGIPQKFSQVVCQHYHGGGRNALPAGDAIDQIVKDKLMTDAEVRDPWAQRVRLVAVTPQRQGSLGCGLLSGKFTLLSGGPDRRFDTADDVNLGQLGFSGQYAPNHAGCRFYASDPVLRFPTRAFGQREFEDSEFDRGRRDGARFGGRMLQMMGGGGGAERRSANALAASPAPPPAKPAMADLKKALEAPDDDGGADAPVRVREYFPETLLWKPSIITNDDGTFELPVKMADSITTWRLTASANAKGGLLGSAAHGITVFQDFFVDIDFPATLTQNDTVAVPVAVYNYLKEEQTVRLKASVEDWFELLDDAEKKVDLKADQVRGASFRIRVRKLGRHTLTVEARGSRGVADALKREVEVVPDGKMFEAVVNERAPKTAKRTVRIPENAIDGSFKILCKCYPGIFSQLMEGVEGMLGMPHG